MPGCQPELIRPKKSSRIGFRVGDAHELAGFVDETFDVVVMHTLASHVAEPATVLAEPRRLLPPGGRLVVFDGDYASTTFGVSARCRV